MCVPLTLGVEGIWTPMRDLFGPCEGSIRSPCHQLSAVICVHYSLSEYVRACVFHVKGADWLPF